MRDPSRRQREIEHVRADILHAAARAFAGQGLEGATIHDIAREAGYTTTSLYAYYEGKQEIVDALLATMAEEVESAFGAAPPAGLAFPQRLEFLLARWAEFGERWREALSVLFALRDAGDHPPGRRAARLGGDFFQKKLTDWVQGAASAEDLGGEDPETVAYILRGILHGIHLIWQRRGCKDNPRQFVDLALRVFLHGVGNTGGTRADASRRAD